MTGLPSGFWRGAACPFSLLLWVFSAFLFSVASEGAQVTAVSLLWVTMSIRPSEAQSRGDLGWAFMVDMSVRDVTKQHARGPCVTVGLRTTQRLVFL